MFFKYDKVRIKSNSKTGVIVDISKGKDNVEYYTIEEDEKNKNGDYEFNDYTESEIENL